MKKDKLQEALGLLKDDHIAEAAAYKKKPRIAWIPVAAAVLALVILGTALLYPEPPSNLENPTTMGCSNGTGALSTDPYIPVKQPRSISAADYSRFDPNLPWAEKKQLPDRLEQFFKTSIAQILGSNDGENYTYSPLNLYMALSLLGELTDGDEQILQALGTADLATLRSQGNLVWNSAYVDGNNKSLLANSIWLRDGTAFDQGILDALAQNYFTSSFQAQFGLPETDRAIADWVNAQTGDLLKDFTQDIHLDANTVFALYSTVYFRAMWEDGFSSKNNTQAVFHGTREATVTFMNQSEYATGFYRGPGYTAVGLPLKDGSTMWMILPEAGTCPEDLLRNDSCMTMVLNPGSWNGSWDYVRVNLSVPKFDISCGGKLKEDLQALGITRVFEGESRPFDKFLQWESGAWVEDVFQATRVAIDEEGVTAASYIEIPVPGDGRPPETVVDFVLDRPFLFVISNSFDLPLFAGVVNDLS